MDITHRYTKTVMFSSPARTFKETMDEAVKSSADLQGSDLRGADLQGATLRGADLQGADLQGATLRGADLWGAYLEGATLQGADLQEATLEGADLGSLRILDAGLRSDGYRFYYTDFPEEGPRIKAGCRNFTIAQGRQHWQKTRGGTALGEETLLLLDQIEQRVALRGWTKEDKKEDA